MFPDLLDKSNDSVWLKGAHFSHRPGYIACLEVVAYARCSERRVWFTPSVRLFIPGSVLYTQSLFCTSVHLLYPVRSPQSAVRSPPSAVRSPQSAVRSPQSAVHGPQSIFYTVRTTNHWLEQQTTNRKVKSTTTCSAFWQNKLHFTHFTIKLNCLWILTVYCVSSDSLEFWKDHFKRSDMNRRCVFLFISRFICFSLLLLEQEHSLVNRFSLIEVSLKTSLY